VGVVTGVIWDLYGTYMGPMGPMACGGQTGTDGGRRYKEQLDKIHCVISN